MKPTHQSVREVLASCGPMTGAEIASFWPEEHRRTVSAIISTMHRDLAKKQVRISRWQRETEGQRLYLRAVYTLGCGRDAPKPQRLTNSERCARYKARKKIEVPAGVPNSVWQLAGFPVR